MAVKTTLYLRSLFWGYCAIRPPTTESFEPLVFGVPFIVLDPQKLRERLDSLERENTVEDDTDDTKTGVGKKNKAITLYLNEVGDLWREPKKKYCYKMRQASNRHKIIRYLADNKGYQSTGAILVFLGGKSKKTIRTEIDKIRGHIEKRLKMDGKGLVENRRTSGYRINPKYKILLVRS